MGGRRFQKVKFSGARNGWFVLRVVSNRRRRLLDVLSTLDSSTLELVPGAFATSLERLVMAAALAVWRVPLL